MKSKLLYYLSFIFLVSVFACSEDDEIPEVAQPEDAKFYAFKPLQIINKVDSNGNTYIVSGTLLVDPDINVEEDPDRTENVIIQIVRFDGGEEIELTRGSAFNLSGNTDSDAQSFDLDFSGISNSKAEINIAANILEASTGRKIKGAGIIQKIESLENDREITYKFKELVFTGVDNNGDGYFKGRDISFRISLESNVSRELTGKIEMFRVGQEALDLTLVDTFALSQFTVAREGSSPTTFNIQLNDPTIDLERSRYELVFTFFSVETGEIVFKQEYRAANGYAIGFEPANYDSRDWDLDSASVDIIPQNGTIVDGFSNLSIDLFVFTNNMGLTYYNPNASNIYHLKYPKVKVQYELSSNPGDILDYPNGLVQLSADPINAQQVTLVLDGIEVLPTSSAEEVSFYIQILEDEDNYLTPQQEDVVLHQYGPASFPGLTLKMKP